MQIMVCQATAHPSSIHHISLTHHTTSPPGLQKFLRVRDARGGTYLDTKRTITSLEGPPQLVERRARLTTLRPGRRRQLAQRVEHRS